MNPPNNTSERLGSERLAQSEQSEQPAEPPEQSAEQSEPPDRLTKPGTSAAQKPRRAQKPQQAQKPRRLAYFPRFSFFVKIFIVFSLVLAGAFAVTLSVVRYIDQEVFYSQKGENLMSYAKMLNLRLSEGGYDEILARTNTSSASREEKIAALNQELQGIANEIASVSAGIGAGYYSRELDAIIAYGPYEEFGSIVGNSLAADHPGRTAMAANKPQVSTGTMLRGNIMSAQYPLVRNGEVIGYCFANELTSDLENSLQTISVTLFILLGALYVIMAGIIIIFSRRMLKAERKSTAAIKAAATENSRLNNLMNIVNDAVASLFAGDTDSFEDILQDAMRMIAAAFEVDRVFIWKSAAHDAGAGFTLVARWLDEIGEQSSYLDIENNGFPQIASASSLPDMLNKNQAVKLLNSKLSLEEQEAMGAYQIMSALFVPVFLQEKFWGMVSFTNCHCERDFSKGEEEILSSASILMANTFARNEMMRQLVIAREDALAGARAKSAFLASMSHEIRTPMNAIIGMTTIGMTSESSQRKDYALQRIADASTHLLSIINDVLDISKIEAGKIELAPVTFDFKSMLRRVESVIGHRISEKEQHYTVTVDSSVPANLLCDEQRLVQVITNLLSNAVKFTQQGGSIGLHASLITREPDLHTSLVARESAEPAPGDDEYSQDSQGLPGQLCTLQIDVSDSGIGLSSSQQQRVFTAFEQAESGTSRKFGGTGLGLSISKSLVELMGGRIWVNSELGRGSTFSFTVEAQRMSKADGGQACVDAEAEVPAGPAPPAPAAPPAEPALTALPKDDDNDFSEYCVLLVEDVEINREIVLTLLEFTGLAIDCAENGAQALERFLEHPDRYDMIFMDIQMPEMDGNEATRRIRALGTPQAAAVPIVAMSANAFNEDIAACMASGMNAHIAKPLNLNEVLAALRKYLKGQ